MGGVEGAGGLEAVAVEKVVRVVVVGATYSGVLLVAQP